MNESSAHGAKFKDGDRVVVTAKGMWRQPTPDWKPFIVLSDGRCVDPAAWVWSVEAQK